MSTTCEHSRLRHFSRSIVYCAHCRVLMHRKQGDWIANPGGELVADGHRVADPVGVAVGKIAARA